MSYPGNPIALSTKVQTKDQHKDDYHLPLQIPDCGSTSETKQDNHPLNQNRATLHRFLLNFHPEVFTQTYPGNLTPVPPEVIHRPLHLNMP